MILAGLFGAGGVAIGAYTAHGAAGTLDTRTIAQLETASIYAILHSAALLGLCSLHGRHRSKGSITITGLLFAAGLVFFCGGVTLFAFGILPSAATAPFGGLSFILGWAMVGFLGLTALRQNTSENR